MRLADRMLLCLLLWACQSLPREPFPQCMRYTACTRRKCLCLHNTRHSTCSSRPVGVAFLHFTNPCGAAGAVTSLLHRNVSKLPLSRCCRVQFDQPFARAGAMVWQWCDQEHQVRPPVTCTLKSIPCQTHHYNQNAGSAARYSIRRDYSG